MNDGVVDPSKRRVLVTGGGGFVGQWLAKALLARGDQVWLSGLGQRPTAPAIVTASEWPGIRWLTADVRRQDAIERMLDESRPHQVFHLAGISFVPEAEQKPELARDVNVGGAVRLLEGVARRQADGVISPTIVIVGSGTQYGVHDESEMPLTEDAEQRPANFYAVTKKEQEEESLRIGAREGLRVICTRSFSHSGVGHDDRFLLPALVKRIRAAQGGNITIGNDVIRDYTHIDDVVDAYLALADRGRSGTVYNIASGTGVGVRDLAEEALALAGSTGKVVSDPALQRAADMPVLIGSPKRLETDTGWRRRKTHRDILSDLIAASQ